MFSFCFLVHNEGNEYLSKLFEDMYKTLQDDEEIIICDDNSTDESTIDFLNAVKSLNDNRIKFFTHSLNNNFAEHKNFLISKCSKEYIFLMDADESLSKDEYEIIRKFVIEHKDNDMFALHRTNLLTDLKPEIIDWFKEYDNKIIDENTIQVVTNCYQYRIWKNHKNIRYGNIVHEMLTGYTKPIQIPENLASILHKKTCQRQYEQGQLYIKLSKIK